MKKYNIHLIYKIVIVYFTITILYAQQGNTMKISINTDENTHARNQQRAKELQEKLSSPCTIVIADFSKMANYNAPDSLEDGTKTQVIEICKIS